MTEVIAKNRQLYKSLFRNASVGIALVDDKGVLVRVNQRLCALLGFSESELLEMEFRDFTYPEDVEKDLVLFSCLLSREIDSYKMEKRYIRKDGSIFWGLMTVSVARQDDGSNIVMRMVQNIDASKKTEETLLKSKERLIQHNAYKDRLFSTIAHDLRGPVKNAVRLLELFEKNSASFSKEKMVEVMSQLRRNMTSTSDLLENLLTWSHSQFREVSYEPIALLLSEEVASVAEQLRQQARQKKVSIKTLFPANLKVMADLQMLHVILRNLISNAIKFSEVGATVVISAVRESSFIYVSVTDEGVGMSEENRMKLLNRNMEGFTSYGTSGEKGTGLGINLCIDYIERHGGTLQISSKEGKGSSFTFSIPNPIVSTN